MRGLSVALLVLMVGAAQAATVVKCVDAAGKVTFSQHACPSAEHDSAVMSVNNQRPSGDGPAIRLADPAKPTATVRRQGQKYTVVGEPEELPETPIQAERQRAAPAAVKPCVRYVEKQINTSRVTADGKRRGQSEIVKVPVPC